MDSMAMPVVPDFAGGIAAAIGQLTSALRLPTDWVASPSFRWTPDGATLHVVWGPPRARASEAAASAAKTKKKKKRSKASQERSALRASAHRERRKEQESTTGNPQSTLFPLRPSAPPFVPDSASPSPPPQAPTDSEGVAEGGEEGGSVGDTEQHYGPVGLK